MRLNNLASTLALIGAVSGALSVGLTPTAASAQMAVFDASAVANTAQQITQLKAQLDQMVKTYETVTSQLRKAEEAYNAVTGVRNLGDIFNNPALRQYLPADMKRVYDASQAGGYRGISGTVDEILKLEALSGSTKDQMRQINQPGEADNDAIVIFVTHKAAPADISHALSQFSATGVLVGQPVAIRIEQI